MCAHNGNQETARLLVFIGGAACAHNGNQETARLLVFIGGAACAHNGNQETARLLVFIGGRHARITGIRRRLVFWSLLGGGMRALRESGDGSSFGRESGHGWE